VALAGKALRRPSADVCGRERDAHFHDTPLRTGTQRKEGLRQGSQKPGQEHYSHCAAITLEGGMGESMTIEGATDAEAFEAYVEHFLAPDPQRGSGGGARQARGAQDTEGQGAR
jgi:hypothetical protein